MSLSIKNALVFMSLMAQCWSVRAETEAQQNVPVFGADNMIGHVEGGVMLDAVPVVPVDEAAALHLGPPVIAGGEPALHVAPVLSGEEAVVFTHDDDQMGFNIGGPKDARAHLRGATGFFFRR